jgi:hypothetical protein
MAARPGLHLLPDSVPRGHSWVVHFTIPAPVAASLYRSACHERGAAPRGLLTVFRDVTEIRPCREAENPKVIGR